jgi:hypothetical protein
MIRWSGYDWITNERWGLIHEKKSNQWYDQSCVQIDQDNNLHLKTKLNPRFFQNLNIISPIGIGLVSCTEKFYHGIYEIKAKLPYGVGLWPAFWMYSWDGWPPEIDIFEGYSVKNPNYFKFNLFKPFNIWDVKSNIHFTKKDGQRKEFGAKTHFWGFNNPTKKFFKYGMDWQENYVNFYYDQKLVRTINDPFILNQLNKTTMNVIINNAVMPDVTSSNLCESDFIVNYFKYEKTGEFH